MKLIVGLGNPGNDYTKSRHNVGFMVLDKLISKYNTSVSKSKFQGLYSEAIINNEKIIFLKPQKYMNLSGEVLRDFVNFYKVPIKDILVFADDLDLPCGKIRVKQKGSCGGHNGLRNIETNLGTQEYNRVKVGISNNKETDTKDYVLGKFSKDELETINDSVSVCCSIFADFIDNNIDYIMSKYNCN